MASRRYGAVRGWHRQVRGVVGNGYAFMASWHILVPGVTYHSTPAARHIGGLRVHQCHLLKAPLPAAWLGRDEI